MEYERLPSGVFFTISNPQVDVQPLVVNHQPLADRIHRSSETGLPLRQRHEFRIAPSAVDGRDDRRYLPLLEVSLDIKVVATVSRTVLTQIYSNHSDITIKEATYCFPLYDASAVVEFRAWIGKDRLLEGKIKPKDVAKAEFQEAVSRQRAAVLLEELTPEVFETSLGNIPAHTTVKVEIQYVNELRADLGGDGVLVTVPTSVAPRYGNPPQDYGRASTSRSMMEPEENGLKIQVEVSAPVPIRKLESRTHPISVELGGESQSVVANSFRDLASASASSNTAGFDPKKARATLSNRTTTLGKDFVLLILATDATILASRALIEHIPNRPDHSALMVAINPRELLGSKIAVESARAEILFVADRSGSMADKIEALKRAMRVFLKSIPQNCYFNICSFGSSYSLLWPEARRYTQENLETAEGHIRDSFVANMGGTEILSAIKSVVERRNKLDGVTTEVILLTDGEVWDTDATIKFVQETRTKTDNNVRFFALGIGDAVSHRLVEGIGHQGGGFSEVVAVDTAGRWESRVIRMLKGALTPPRWNCEILLPKATPKIEEDSKSVAMLIQRPALLQAPNQIPTLHAFRRTSVYFLIDTQLMAKSASITVQIVTVSREKIQMEIPLEQTNATPLTIHYLAAKAVMNDLETGRSWMHADKYQEYQKKHPASFEQAVKSEAEKIGIEWSMVGKWTSFIAVDNSDQVEQKTRIYRAERSELADLMRPRYSGKLKRLKGSRNTVPRPLSLTETTQACSPTIASHSGSNYFAQGDLAFEFTYNAISELDRNTFNHSCSNLYEECGLKIDDRQLLPTLDSLIGLQKFPGYFLFSDKIFRSRVLEYFAPSVMKKLNERVRQKLRWPFQKEKIGDTILIIIFIEAQYPESSELYGLVVQKARSWLRGRIRRNETLNELEEIVRDEMWKGKDKNENAEDGEDETEDLSSRKDKDDKIDADEGDTKAPSS